MYEIITIRKFLISKFSPLFSATNNYISDIFITKKEIFKWNICFLIVRLNRSDTRSIECPIFSFSFDYNFIWIDHNFDFLSSEKIKKNFGFQEEEILRIQKRRIDLFDTEYCTYVHWLALQVLFDKNLFKKYHDL